MICVIGVALLATARAHEGLVGFALGRGDSPLRFAPKHTRRELAGMRCVDCSWKCRAFHLSKVEVGLYSTRRHVRLTLAEWCPLCG